ncbi:hypothetical protein PtA15_9A384 [Puccinia triticina]|uniref:Uncharacterized protein n=1 Tax=Puccinia triticina TaxID=208348 RepID=A0ABY7CZX3_9BASI|nr:uncharacterized protein PtA15_9A384 [Puccinia triticina]WAQ88257.1 hypothetical protein PtA15_9A384 [Puccinia triticina]
MDGSKNNKNEQNSEAEELSPIITTFDLPSTPSAPPPPAAGPTSQKHHHHHQTTTTKPLQTNWKSDTRNFRIQGWDPPEQLELEGGPRNVAMIIDWRAMAGTTTLHTNQYNPNHRLDGWAGFGRLPESLGRKPFRVGNRLPHISISNPTNHSNLSDSNLGLLDKISLGLGPDWIQNNLNYSGRTAELFSDSNRAWVISIAWLISSLIGVFILYEIVRRPKHIMDHSLTICLNHLILTTYYSAHLPSSLCVNSATVSA